MEDILYTVKEVSSLIKTNPSYVYLLIEKGLLKAMKLGSLKVRRSTLLEFLAENEGKDFSNLEDIKELGLNREGDEN